MPIFLTEEEFRICSNDPLLVASKADEFILSLRRQLETSVAEADAASVTAEQNYNVLEQRYASLSAEIERVQAENEELVGDAEKKANELAEVWTVKLGNEAVLVSKDGEIERLKVEVLELHKSKRQLLELTAQKDEEIEEKNATIQSYLDKIVKLTEDAKKKECSLHDIESDMARCEATCSRLSQEKEFIEKHSIWLNDELNDKINSLSEHRKMHIDFEIDMTNKLADVERNFNDSSRLLRQSEEKSQEYLAKITSMEEELLTSKNTLVMNEERYTSELSIVSKLVELYKASSEEWSKKAEELEGVIKALEIHVLQVENDYKDKLEKEFSARKEFEKDAEDMKEKLQKYEIEIDKAKTPSEAKLLQLLNIDYGVNMDDVLTDEPESDSQNEYSCLVAPKAPMGISGTALAASLLRDGWTLAKMYEKYHEAADALRHERWGRKHAESILERVLQEIEQKAETIFNERVEHEKMVESYSSLNQKLQLSLKQTEKYETSLRTLNAELKKHDREYAIAQKEICDLQKQISVLLKECRDAQICCGVRHQDFPSEVFNTISSESDHSCNINDLTFRDIAELVEQNSQLRNLVHNLSNVEKTEIVELKKNFEIELQKANEAADNKVETVLKRCEEHDHMIQSLHGSVAMYKRLYEEQSKIPSSESQSLHTIPVASSMGEGKQDILFLLQGSQESAKVAQNNLAQLNKSLEEDLTKLRSEVMDLRLEHDKIKMEAKFSQEKSERFMKDLEYQRDEANGVRARNVELSQLLLDYQRKFRESSDLLRASEDLSRKLYVEISVLKNEKEILKNAEKRATDEVISLSERVQRIQSSLDTIHSVEEVREESRLIERSKHEGHLRELEKEWADMKKELQEEHDHVRILKSEKERVEEDLKKQVEEIRKELSDSVRAVSFAEKRAAVAEARLYDLEKLLKSSSKVVDSDGVHNDLAYTNNEGNVDLCKLRDEMEKLREETCASKDHMTQYKEIARTNELALKQIKLAQQAFKAEAEKEKCALESELHSLKESYSDLENRLSLKSAEALSVLAEKENAFISTASEITHLKEECLQKTAKILELETETYSLKEVIEAEHERWRSAQTNYERQVILQSETIQELNKTSVTQAALQDEIKELQKYSDSLKVENDKLNASWQSERSILLSSKEEAEQKYAEIEEQNKILHDHLEALHIKLSDKDTTSTAGKTAFDSTGDSKMQNVINYLRHAKEIANTEVMLLRQEKLRLQSQLETAVKASERAQELLQSERENAKAISFTDDEFKSLQFQVREINLLRESNAQLREENKHYFLDCEKLRKIMEKDKLDNIQLFNEKDVALDGCQKEINTLKEIKGRLEDKNEELLGKLKNIDIVEYERLKNDIKQYEASCEGIGRYGPGYTPPTPYQISGSILKKEVEDINQLRKEHEDSWSRHGCTLMSDGWTDRRGRSIINFLVNSAVGTFYLHSIDCTSDMKTGEFIAQGLSKVIDKIGSEKVVQVCIDNSSNYVMAGTMLMEKYPHLFWTPCAAHVLDLALEDIGREDVTGDQSLEYDLAFQQCISKMIPEDISLRMKVLSDSLLYKEKAGLFGAKEAIMMAPITHPLKWWTLFGLETSELRKIATRILGLCCSALSCERNWSTFAHVKLKERGSEIDILKNLLLEKEQNISNFERELAMCRSQVEQQQKKISDSLQIQATLNLDLERHKKFAIQFKKRALNLTKEKEGLNSENQNLQKQLEDYKSCKKSDAQMINEDAIKVMEKATRIQILEKTLEREREVLRKEKEINKKEKAKQMKTENTVIEHVRKIWQERKKLLEEIKLYKLAVCNVLEGIGVTANQLPVEYGLDEQTVAYLFSVSNFEETVNVTHSDGINVRQLISDSSSALDNTDKQISRPTAGIVSHIDKSGEVKEKAFPKMGTDPRKTVRRIIRPRLEKSEDLPLDIETLDTDSFAAMEVKVGEPHEESSTDASLSRKRLASSSVEMKEENIFQRECVPEPEELPRKKSKGTEHLLDATEKNGIPSSENVNILSLAEDVHDTTVSQLHKASEEGMEMENIGKEEKLEFSIIGLQEAGDPMNGSKSNETDEAVNEFETIPKGDEESHEHQPMILSEDDHEEGELSLTDQDARLEEGEFQSGQGESISVDRIESLETAVVEETCVEDINEAKPSDDDEVVEVSDKILNSSDQSSVDHESSNTLLQPSNITTDRVITEELPQSTAIESNESKAGSGDKSSTILDMANQNSLQRQAAMSTSARGSARTSRGRGGRNAVRGRGRTNEGKQG